MDIAAIQSLVRPTSTPAGAQGKSPTEKARATAQEFEGVFLQTMLEHMFQGLGEEGPLGNGEAGSAWRGLLVQEYATSIANSGGIGIADSVYREILSLQEAQSGRAG